MKETHGILASVKTPRDVKSIDEERLDEFCAEIRETLVSTVSKTGGHLSSNLGVVELTVALLRAFDLENDDIVWDVGHQCYVYKMLTGRLDRMTAIRKSGGIAGFPNPKESGYDTFVVGHSSTSVSAANGIAKAKKLTDADGYTVAVIGDGALSGGLAYEGLSNAGRSSDKLIVVLNDNQMSISPNVGFSARHLGRLRNRLGYMKFKNAVSTVFKHIPVIGKSLYKVLHSSKNTMKRAILKDVSFFEDMGFYYIGPIDGHDIPQLTRAFETARTLGRPVVVHAETVKGKGYTFAEKDPGAYHGVGHFDPAEKLVPSAVPSFSTVFGDMLDMLADEDARIVGITAAMKHGTCMLQFAKRMPSRCFDTGIAESHAVTFASGLAVGGMIPIFAVYSTFLQRAYDQLLNDTAIMNNHIVLAVDRAGIVPDEGETHQGIFDVAFLSTIPNTVIYAPATFEELKLHLKKATYEETGIAAVRYPRGGEPTTLTDYRPAYTAYTLEENDAAQTLVITYGREYAQVLPAAALMAQNGQPVSVLKLNRIYPVDAQVIEIAKRYDRVVFVEEGAKRGGLGEQIASLLMENGFKGRYVVRAIDGFIPPCTLEEGMKRYGLDADSVYTLLAQGDAV